MKRVETNEFKITNGGGVVLSRTLPSALKYFIL